MNWAHPSLLRLAIGRLGLASLVFVSIAGAPAIQAKAPAGPPQASVALADLPKEAQRTELLIRSAGPFPHAKDGTVFGNRERQLPRRERGFYREYTVATPGASNRGARRIVCGGEVAAKPEVCFYTADHYASFKRIVP